MCENCENPELQIFIKTKLMNASTKALDKTIQKYYENIYRMEIELGIGSQSLIDLHKRQTELREQLLAKDDAQLPPIMFVTISPRYDIPVEKLKVLMARLIRKKWIEKYIYVFEQRGEAEDNIYGTHIHLLIHRKGKRASQVIREITNSVKHVTDVMCDKTFNIKFVKEDDENVARVLEYITGVKADESKHKKQEIDKIYREKYGLKDYYQNGYM